MSFLALRRRRNSWGPTDTDSDIDDTDSPWEKYEVEDYASRRHTVYHIAFLLRQRLVPDVVPLILHHADLYYHEGGFIESDHAYVVEEADSPRVVCASAAVRCGARTTRPVRKVVFEIESHDQGWASDLNGGSWTWFEARICRPGTEDAKPQPGKEIVRNIIARRNFQHHRIEWNADDPDKDVGSWVGSLRVGDHIEVLACAQFVGWRNVCRKVRVSVYTAIVV